MGNVNDFGEISKYLQSGHLRLFAIQLILKIFDFLLHEPILLVCLLHIFDCIFEILILIAGVHSKVWLHLSGFDGWNHGLDEGSGWDSEGLDRLDPTHDPGYRLDQTLQLLIFY